MDAFAFHIHNKLRLPKRIILIRHGESLGNVDHTTYKHIPDWKIPLTRKGIIQAENAGILIKSLIGNGPLSIYCSPYRRTKESLVHIMSNLSDNPLVHVREEPRLTEQQFGNFQNPDIMLSIKQDRKDYGRFYYRFPNGESGLDCYNRVTSFISTLFRDWIKETESQEDNTVLLVTHGLFIRLFIMRWFQYTVEEFEETSNPDNGTVLIMKRKSPDVTKDGFEHMKLTEKSRKYVKFPYQHKHSIESKISPNEHLDKLLSSVYCKSKQDMNTDDK